MPTSRKKVFEVMKLDPKDFREMTWLWYPYIPAGNETMIYGPGGMGKSSVCCDIAARLSRGDPLPGQTESAFNGPIKVLILSVEDDPYFVLGPRLEKMGADFNNIFFAPEGFVLDRFALTDLEEHIKHYSVAVVFIDPVVAYMGGKKDMNRMNEVREFTGGLQRLAQRTGTSIITVHHARKAREGGAADAAAGSADFINAARSAMYVHEGPSGGRVLEHAKTNYGPRGDTLSFTVDDGIVTWGRSEKPGQAGKGGTSPKVQAAKAFLQEVLAAGPIPAAELEELAESEGIPRRTLFRAKPGVAESYFTRNTETGKLSWHWRLLGWKKKETGDETEVSNVGAGAGGDGKAGGGDRESGMDPQPAGGAGEANPGVDEAGRAGAGQGAGEFSISTWLKQQGLK